MAESNRGVFQDDQGGSNRDAIYPRLLPSEPTDATGDEKCEWGTDLRQQSMPPGTNMVVIMILVEVYSITQRS